MFSLHNIWIILDISLYEAFSFVVTIFSLQAVVYLSFFV